MSTHTNRPAVVFACLLLLGGCSDAPTNSTDNSSFSNQQSSSSKSSSSKSSSSNLQANIVPGQPIPREMIDRDDVVAVTQALRDGADPNAVYEKYDDQALHIAAYMRAHRVLRLLVDSGANVNAANEYGMTVLMNSVLINDPKLAELLIQKGADPNLTDLGGPTPLMLAASHGFDEVVTVLIESGADVTAQARGGATALSEAVSRRNVQTVKLLLARGAKMDQKTEDEARKTDDPAILESLGLERVRDERASQLLAAAKARRDETHRVSLQEVGNPLQEHPGNESARPSEKGAEFHMIHATRGNTSIGAFDREGPRLSTMQKAPNRLDFITYDPSTGIYFGQETATLGVIDNGELIPIETPDNVDLSHSGGLAFDAENRSVLVASRSGAGTVLYEYMVDANSWKEIGNIGCDDFHGLACDSAQGTIYVLDKPHHTRGCSNVRVLNRRGAQVAVIDLSTPVPYYSELRPKLQLAFAKGSLYAMVSHSKKHPRVTESIYAIDPASGEVSRMPYNASVDLTSKTWPAWTDGPPPSLPMSSTGAKGSGFYSNYRTPSSLVSGQRDELHVIAIGSGEMNYLEWLKKIKKIRASSRKGGGLAIQLELDLDAEVKYPVVEVFVEKTREPVTLALVSGMPVIWSIGSAPDAKIEKVITYSHPLFSESKVIGVNRRIVVNGGKAPAAEAWEIDKSPSANEFGQMIQTIRDATALRENSFQGMDLATAFRIQ